MILNVDQCTETWPRVGGKLAGKPYTWGQKPTLSTVLFPSKPMNWVNDSHQPFQWFDFREIRRKLLVLLKPKGCPVNVPLLVPDWFLFWKPWTIQPGKDFRLGYGLQSDLPSYTCYCRALTRDRNEIHMGSQTCGSQFSSDNWDEDVARSLGISLHEFKPSK